LNVLFDDQESALSHFNRVFNKEFNREFDKAFDRKFDRKLDRKLNRKLDRKFDRKCHDSSLARLSLLALSDLFSLRHLN